MKTTGGWQQAVCFLMVAVCWLTIFSDVAGAAERETTVGDFYEEGGNYYGGGVVPEIGQDVFLFADLPWEEMGISTSGRVPQWLGYGPSRWTFMTAPSNQMLLQGKLTDAGLTVVDLTANLIFEISKMAVLIGNVIVISSFHNYAADFLPGLVSQSIKALYGSGLQSSGDGNAFPMWQFAVGLAVLGLGASVAIHFFRARLARGVLNYALAAMLLAFLLTYFAEADAIAAWVNRVMDQGTALVVVGTFNAMIVQDEGTDSKEAFDDTLLRITETTWDLMVGRPWALGQWGTYEMNGHGQDSLRLSSNELQELQKNSYSDILGGFFEPASVLGNGAQPVEIPLQAAYIDKIYLGGNETTRSKLLEMVQSRDSVVHIACGQEWMSATRHVEYALLSVIPALAYAFLAISTGVPVFVAQIMMGIALIFFPLVIIAGVSGDGGRRLLIAYSRTALGLLLTKIVYGLYLALTLALISLLWKTFSFSYAITTICVCALMFYALKYRRHAIRIVFEILMGTAPAPQSNGWDGLTVRQAGLLMMGRRVWHQVEGAKSDTAYKNISHAAGHDCADPVCTDGKPPQWKVMVKTDAMPIARHDEPEPPRRQSPGWVAGNEPPIRPAIRCDSNIDHSPISKKRT